MITTRFSWTIKIHSSCKSIRCVPVTNTNHDGLLEDNVAECLLCIVRVADLLGSSIRCTFRLLSKYCIAGGLLSVLGSNGAILLSICYSLSGEDVKDP